MDAHTNDNPLKAKVLAAIESGKVAMRPRWHFVLQAALAVVGLVFLALALVYLVSFIIFTMRESGAWYVTPFGLRGLRTFLTAAPWALILVAAALLGILEALVRRYAFAYRRPLLYSVLGVAALALLTSFAVASTPLHPGLLRHADARRLPIGGSFYRGYGHQEAPDVHPGFVVKLLEAGFEMESPRGRAIPVLITPATKLVPDRRLSVGEHVIVFGPEIEGRIQAFGIRRALPPRDRLR